MGDVASTEEDLAQCVQIGMKPEEFYNDPDLGPILRTEPFKGLREKYPEPPKP